MANFGHLTVVSGIAKNSKARNVPLSARAVEILKRWNPTRESGYVFHRQDGSPLSETVLDQQHARVRQSLKLRLNSFSIPSDTHSERASAKQEQMPLR
jgi:integrase